MDIANKSTLQCNNTSQSVGNVTLAIAYSEFIVDTKQWRLSYTCVQTSNTVRVARPCTSEAEQSLLGRRMTFCIYNTILSTLRFSTVGRRHVAADRHTMCMLRRSLFHLLTNDISRLSNGIDSTAQFLIADCKMHDWRQARRTNSAMH